MLNLTCSAQNLAIAWYHENIPLETAESGRIHANRLEIPDISFEQAGWYTCTTSNQSGRAEREFLVVVGGKECKYCNVIQYWKKMFFHISVGSSYDAIFFEHNTLRYFSC